MVSRLPAQNELFMAMNVDLRFALGRGLGWDELITTLQDKIVLLERLRDRGVDPKSPGVLVL